MSCVLVTGATGVIGSEIVPRLLELSDNEVVILLRARSPEHLRRRMNELFEYWRPVVREDVLRLRVRAVAGDVGRSRLGVIESAEYGQLCSEVSHIVHCAGNVRLNQSMDEARRNAVAAVDHVLEFARACGAGGQLQKIDVVTTIGVAGRMRGLVAERRITEDRSFHNTYEAAKAEAEEVVFRAIDESLPVTIHRPSMVVGNSQTGRVKQFQVFYYLCEFLSGFKTCGFMVDLDNAALDIVPVDYVAEAICLASRDTATAGRVFHLCAGTDHSLRLNDLAARLRVLAAHQGLRTFRPKVLPRRWFELLLRMTSEVTWGRVHRSLQTLPYFLEYLDTHQMFDVVETTAYLEPLGCRVPQPHTYLRQILCPYFCRTKRKVNRKSHRAATY
jgi:thioester reductase-like protein